MRFTTTFDGAIVRVATAMNARSGRSATGTIIFRGKAGLAGMWVVELRTTTVKPAADPHRTRLAIQASISQRLSQRSPTQECWHTAGRSRRRAGLLTSITILWSLTAADAAAVLVHEFARLCPAVGYVRSDTRKSAFVGRTDVNRCGLLFRQSEPWDSELRP